MHLLIAAALIATPAQADPLCAEVSGLASKEQAAWIRGIHKLVSTVSQRDAI